MSWNYTSKREKLLEEQIKELKKTIENSNSTLEGHNNKIDYIQKGLDELIKVFDKYVKAFSEFVDALEKANHELELKRRYKNEALAEFKQQKSQIIDEQDEAVELTCFNCGSKMYQQKNTFRCENLITKKDEDGNYIDSGCETKIFSKYYDWPLKKWQIRDLLAGEKVVLLNPRIKGKTFKRLVIELDKEKSVEDGFYHFHESNTE